MPKVVSGYKEEAKKRIIAAGVEVMSKKGYCQTTMDDIASYLGVTKGTLYIYFRTKDELVVEIVRTTHAEIRAMVAELQPNLDPVAAFTAVFDRLLDNDIRRTSFFFEILAMTGRNEEIRSILSDDIQQSMDLAGRGISRLQKEGKIRPDADPRTLALGLFSLMSGLNSFHLRGMDKEELRERWREIAPIILGGNPGS